MPVLDAFPETRRSRWRRRRRSRRSSTPDYVGRPPSPSTARGPSPRPASSARTRPSRYSSGVLDYKSRCDFRKAQGRFLAKVFSKKKDPNKHKKEKKKLNSRSPLSRGKHDGGFSESRCYLRSDFKSGRGCFQLCFLSFSTSQTWYVRFHGFRSPTRLSFSLFDASHPRVHRLFLPFLAKPFPALLANLSLADYYFVAKFSLTARLISKVSQERARASKPWKD